MERRSIARNVLISWSVANAAAFTAHHVQAQADEVLMWQAAGLRDSSCSSPDACKTSLGLACVSGHCQPAGAYGQACRPSDHPLGTWCNEGLACGPDALCYPAGGDGQLCRDCGVGSGMEPCTDRCDPGLGCDPEVFLCLPGGGSAEPCREAGEVACNGGLACWMGRCAPTGGEHEACDGFLSCQAGLFCELANEDSGVCVREPRGLASASDTPEASSCVDDVPGAFAHLASFGGHTRTFSFDAREGSRLPPDNAKVAEFDLDLLDQDVDHVQGIVRLPDDSGRFLITRDSEDEGPAGLMIVDRTDARFLFPVWDAYHPGGLSMFGHTVAVAVEEGFRTRLECSSGIEICQEYTDFNLGWVDLWEYRPQDAASPMRKRSAVTTIGLPGDGHRPSAAAFTRKTDGRGLMFVLGRKSAEGWLLHQHSTTSSPGPWKLMQHFSNLGSLPGWHMFQNIHFVTDCAGELYLVGSASNGKDLPSQRANHVVLYRLVATARAEFTLQFVQHWSPKYDRDRCDLLYSGNPVISEGELSYVCSDGTSDIASSENIGVAEIGPVPPL